MSKQTVNQVIQRAIGDAAFRRQLQRDPSSALAGFDLTKDERAAITSGDPTRLTALGVDQRMSKAFGLGGMSEVSKTVIDDTSSAGSAAFIDEGTTAGTGAIVSPEMAQAGSADIIDSEGFLPSVNVGDPQSGASSAVDVSAPTHLQTVEADLNSPDMARSAFESLDTSGDANVLDPGLVGGTAARTDFIDVGDGSGGDMNVLDPGLVGGGQAGIDPGDLSGDASVLGEESSGLDTGGDIRPTEY